MSRFLRALAFAALAAAAIATNAWAHAGNPNYRSVPQGVSPATPGLSVDVLNFDDRLEITNKTGKPITIFGYDHEPYARLLANGTVQVNQRSPANYLNDDRYAQAKVPASANPKAPAQWKTLDATGRFDWHDHRIHWMSTALPPQVKNKARKTKIFDYRVPIQVGSQRAAITGTLYWVPEASGFPVAAGISLAVVLALLIGFGVFMRRRRAHGDDGDHRAESAEPPREKVTEAW
jgi:hypothetical protein